MNYAEAEEYINQIPRFSKVKSEENVDEILALFGHPEKKFAYIHVAGTNGKGSVCAFLDSMLRMAGKKTGLFTSPHLITTTERMKINGQNISEEAFTEIFEELLHVVKVREKAGHLHPTYFEWLYLMAMLWFGRQGIEYGIIETGLGGRLDATNHIAQPVLTIITSISYDHMEILGSTLTEIAGEKAGILKSGVPVICDGSEPEAMAVIRKRAAILHCPLKVIEPCIRRITVFCCLRRNDSHHCICIACCRTDFDAFFTKGCNGLFHIWLYICKLVQNRKEFFLKQHI